MIIVTRSKIRQGDDTGQKGAASSSLAQCLCLCVGRLLGTDTESGCYQYDQHLPLDLG
jgi:hypothetical protein